MKCLFIASLVLPLQYAAVRADNVTLPDKDTDEGLLARLLIAESLTPNRAQYDADSVKKGMRAMKAAVDNRLKNKPAQFGAPNAKNYVDIVGAAGQFAGFSKNAGKIVISSEVQARIDDVLKKANSGKPGKYAAFVENSIAVAKNPVDDPFKDVKKIGTVEVLGGSFGWRPVDKGSPGGNFLAIPASQGGIVGGNQFYSVKK